MVATVVLQKRKSDVIRDAIEFSDFDGVITQIRVISNDRFIKKLTTLTIKEMTTVKKLFDEITE